MIFQIASTRSPFHLFYIIACLSKGFHSPWTPPINSSWQANDILTKLFWHDIILKQLKIKPLNFSYQFLFLTNLWNKCHHSISSPSSGGWHRTGGKDRVRFKSACWCVSLIRLEFWHSCFSHMQINLCRIKTAATKRTRCTWLWLVIIIHLCFSKVCESPRYDDVLCQEMVKSKPSHDIAPWSVYFHHI